MPTLHTNCNMPGCILYASQGSAYCRVHARQRDRGRGTKQERGYGGQWDTVRAYYLRGHPLCEDCKTQGIYKAAVHVHHMLPVKEYPAHRLRLDNLRALCLTCHARYTPRGR